MTMTQKQLQSYFTFMQELGLNPSSGNNNIHIHAKGEGWQVDLWPTTKRLRTKIDEVTETHTGDYLLATIERFVEKLGDRISCK